MMNYFTSLFEWVVQNKEWFFSGFGVTLLIVIMKWLFNLLFSNRKADTVTNINQTVNISDSHKVDSLSSMNNVVKSKSSTQILFIDDNKVSFINAMKKAGYTLIKWMKDCNNIQCQQILDADIIFVDVNGVGISLFPQEQGFGLAKAIKTKFPSKCVVLYSAEPQYFRKEYTIFDSVLPKNSEPYEFTKIIDDWIQGNI